MNLDTISFGEKRSKLSFFETEHSQLENSTAARTFLSAFRTYLVWCSTWLVRSSSFGTPPWTFWSTNFSLIVRGLNLITVKSRRWSQYRYTFRLVVCAYRYEAHIPVYFDFKAKNIILLKVIDSRIFDVRWCENLLNFGLIDWEIDFRFFINLQKKTKNKKRKTISRIQVLVIVLCKEPFL